jgi:hypothetical protein
VPVRQEVDREPGGAEDGGGEAREPEHACRSDEEHRQSRAADEPAGPGELRRQGPGPTTTIAVA